ncbi:MAM and LDL-receptor class A domain-containing protein 1-like [Tubulanus polymorphus]|uniref:MAM and LDL-receptor class A domain-containing protein 1-like n=1 Tax=Tubulanus polymorphus TaxID=672921 RepID=UPI003DA45807
MNFYYHMYGSTLGVLEVKLNGNVVLERSGDQGNEWKQGSVRIAKGYADIKIVATRGNGDMSNIAIDDVKFSTECTTTPGLWISQGILEWTRRSGSTASSNTGPDGDHTTGNGMYVYVETSGKDPGDQASFGAITQSASDACFMSFYYHMHGSTMGKLEVRLNGKVIFSKSGDQGNRWKRGTVVIGQGNTKIEFVATRGNGFMSDIAIDDIKFTTGCTLTVTPGQLTTDFETDNGKWISLGRLQWTRKSGSTPFSGTGPIRDHTTGNGTYVYMEASGKRVGDQAKFEANTLSVSDSCFVNFYYHMYGSTMGVLEVKLNGNVVFSKSGDQGNQWIQGSVQISKGYATIEFVATRGNGNKSSIAIDDVRFTSECTATPEQLATDFETDTGLWNSEGILQWTRRSSRTPSPKTGPNGDHTTGTGTYVYVETSWKKPGDQASFGAITQSASNACFMSFYYHMYGSHMGKLEVKLNGNVVFSKSGDQGNRWKRGTVVIGQGNTKIEFVAIRGRGVRSDIAIDDIKFTTGCTPTTVAPGQLTTDFETGNGKWISQGTLQWTRKSGGTPSPGTGPREDHTTGKGTYVYLEASWKRVGAQARFEANTLSVSKSCAMNFYYHMYGSTMGKLEVKLNGNVVFSKSGNQRNKWKKGSINLTKGNAVIQFVASRGRGFGSDIAIDDVRFTEECTATPEQLTTDFETDNGKWISQGTLQWTRRSGVISTDTGLSGDHTTGNGTYVYVDTSRKSPGDQGSFGANLQSASDACTVKFYYYMYRSTMGKLEVKVNGKVTFSESGTPGGIWKQESVPIAKGDAVIQFVATLGSDDKSIIAIDDISFSSHC